jgi:DNA-binding IclR family transcriptional regulator
MMTIEEVKPANAPTDGLLARAFHVLKIVGAEGQPVSLAEASRLSGLPKTTAHRVLQQLVLLGAVERAGDQYRIGLEMFVLGSTVPEAWLRGAALTRMLELQRLTGLTLHLGTLRDDRVVYLEKIGPKTSDIPTVVGGSYAAHATALGKTMLANLPPAQLRRVLDGPLETMTSRTISDPAQLNETLERVRKFGVALDDGESVPRIRCVAHPVKYMGTVIAGISISFPSSTRLGDSTVAALRATCTSIANDLARNNLLG